MTLHAVFPFHAHQDGFHFHFSHFEVQARKTILEISAESGALLKVYCSALKHCEIPNCTITSSLPQTSPNNIKYNYKQMNI